MTRRFLSAALAAAAGAALAAPTAPATPDDSPKPAKSARGATADIVQTAARAGNFRTLVSCLVAADLADALKADGPFTVFAPTDEAFARLPAGALEGLLKPENKAKLRAILSYHVVPNKSRVNYEAARAGADYPFATLGGAEVVLTKRGADFFANDSKISARNLACRNGSVQAIDAVLTPPEAGAATVAAKPQGDAIPAVAARLGTFNTLLAAVKAADLAETLSGPGPFTVFAPTDAAFAKLPEGALAELLKPENKKKLVALLKYHVVAGSLGARELAAAGSAKPLAGGAVRASIRGGRLFVNESAVVASDVAAGNGVVHAIDTVLTPSH